VGIFPTLQRLVDGLLRLLIVVILIKHEGNRLVKLVLNVDVNSEVGLLLLLLEALLGAASADVPVVRVLLYWVAYSHYISVQLVFSPELLLGHPPLQRGILLQETSSLLRGGRHQGFGVFNLLLLGQACMLDEGLRLKRLLW